MAQKNNVEFSVMYFTVEVVHVEGHGVTHAVVNWCHESENMLQLTNTTKERHKWP